MGEVSASDPELSELLAESLRRFPLDFFGDGLTMARSVGFKRWGRYKAHVQLVRGLTDNWGANGTQRTGPHIERLSVGVAL